MIRRLDAHRCDNNFIGTLSRRALFAIFTFETFRGNFESTSESPISYSTLIAHPLAHSLLFCASISHRVTNSARVSALRTFLSHSFLHNRSPSSDAFLVFAFASPTHRGDLRRKTRHPIPFSQMHISRSVNSECAIPKRDSGLGASNYGRGAISVARRAPGPPRRELLATSQTEQNASCATRRITSPVRFRRLRVFISRAAP